MNTRLAKSWCFCLSLTNLCLAFQASIFSNAKKDLAPTVREAGTDLQVPKETIASPSALASSADIERETAKPTNQQRDGHFPGSSPDSLSKSRNSSGAARDHNKSLESWPDRIQRLKTRLKTLKSAYRGFVLSLKDFLNLLPRYKQVAVFSEIDHLQEIFGEAHACYKSLDAAGQGRFWETFDQQGNAESAGLSPRLARTATFPRDGTNKRAKAATDTRIRVARSKKTVDQAMDLLSDIEHGKEKYDKALDHSMNLVADFLRQFSNKGKLSDVSQNIRGWKAMHPSGMLPLEHPYQAVFADLFGPGDLAKPEEGDLQSLERLQNLWKVNGQQINAILEVSEDAKSMLADLYMAKERDTQRGLRTIFSSSSRYKQAVQKARQRQEANHVKLLAAFGSEKTLLDKMEELAALRLTEEEWADRRFSSAHYELLPFLDPLRAGRRYEDHPDIIPLLRHFGLHTTPRAIENLMELSEALVPHLKVQYQQQMIVRDFRKALESRFDGATQYRIQLLLRKTVQVVTSSPAHRPLYLRLLHAAKDFIVRFINTIKSRRFSSIGPKRVPSRRPTRLSP